MKKITLKVTGMHCQSCEILLSDALLEAGAKSAKADYKKRLAVIEFDETKLSLDKIKSIIKQEGYTI